MQSAEGKSAQALSGTRSGPTACFQYAVRWLRQNDVLLPGISKLTRLVAREFSAREGGPS
ncbi:hypothetical protein ACIBG4_27360 [Nonomuraea sp. NPDC050383]|uniref:hypothetical protein n=1 Tax=Nonomuraea sp. NPDC050383 TaxID=3364362 RepID=UPI00378DCC5B